MNKVHYYDGRDFDEDGYLQLACQLWRIGVRTYTRDWNVVTCKKCLEKQQVK